MLAWWVAELWQIDKVLLISWVYWVIFSIVLHELAHGWAAIWCGDRTPIESGHMTWNPLVHMGPFSLIMFAFVGIAWGLMPVDPSRFRRHWHDSLVSLAGPVMNLLLAGASIILFALWLGFGSGHWSGATAVNDTLFGNTQVFLRVGIMLNIVLCLFNLIPVPPLDGGRIAANLIPAYRRALESEQAPMITLGIFIAIFFFGGEYIFGAAMDLTFFITDNIARLVF